MVHTTGWLKGLRVTADGTGIVSHAGVALLRALAGNTSLTAGLSGALASDRLLVHDRGRVLAGLACAIADGGEVISDFRVIGDQGELFGLVASVPTAWRTLDEIARGGDRALGKITAAVNAARRRAWAGIEARHGALPGIRVADKTLDGVTCIRLDASVVTCHSEKEGAEPNFKGFGLLTELAKASFLFSQQVASAFITVPAHGRWRAVCGWGGTGGPAGGRAQGDGKSLDAVRAGRRGWRRGCRAGGGVSEGSAGVRAPGGHAAVVCDGPAALVPVLAGRWTWDGIRPPGWRPGTSAAGSSWPASRAVRRRARGYAAATVAHCETVLRCFYDFHLEAGTGPMVNPFPLARGRGRPMRITTRWSRSGRGCGSVPAAAPRRIPRQIPDEKFDRAVRRARVAPGPGAGGVLGVHGRPGRRSCWVPRAGMPTRDSS